ncbi:MAG: hypothetical protein R2716_03200 [Microthrixaceae bacterium]
MSDTAAGRHQRDAAESTGPVGRVLVVLGVAVMAWAVVGVFMEADLSDPPNWFAWLIGAALVHDLLLLPVVLAIGALIAVVPATRARAALRWSIAVSAVITLATFPVAARWGADPTDASELPLPVARNLVVLWAVLVPVALVAGLVADRMAARDPG